jgi:aromatic ring-opening dioxygenase catalytic subunit (LigB family)
MPSVFIPHGGGPCFFMDWTMGPADTWDAMEAFLKGLIASLPRRPTAILTVTAHWHSKESFKLASNARPTLIYDYEGFPPHTYQLTYKAPGQPELATRAAALMNAAGVAAEVDPAHGWDHGVFIPLKVMRPEEDIPVVAMSVRRDFDPAAHLAAGRALAPLRDDDVLILGSGLSFHNLPGFFDPRLIGAAQQFDDWLAATLAEEDMERRNAGLTAWSKAPAARLSQPFEDHLVPLMVAAGASNSPGTQIYADHVMGKAVSAYAFA